MEFSAAIFDVDGTLLDSMPLWEHVGEQYLIEKGCIPKPGMEERVRTMSMSQIADYCRTEYGIADSPETIIEEINGMVLEQYRTQVQAKPGIPELLERLKGEGVRLAVATASDRCLIEPALERTGLLPYFDLFLTCSEVGAGKDSPAIFLKAAETLETVPEQTVVFEDSLYAMKTAARAGFLLAGIFDESAAGEQDAIQTLADWYFVETVNWDVLFQQKKPGNTHEI